MSAEGEDNLDNDGAQDLLVDISERMHARILHLLCHPRAPRYDDHEISELFVAIEVLFALKAGGLIITGADPVALRAATEAYLPRWEEYHRRAGNHEPPEERRASIIATFQRLNAMAEDFDRRRVHFHPLEHDELTPADRSVLDILDGLPRQKSPPVT